MKILYTTVLLNLAAISQVTYAQDITIGSGTTFTLGGAAFTIQGNWNNSGTFVAGTGTVIMNGASGNQTIVNSTGETFNNFTVNKSAGEVQLANAISVNGTCNLISGDLNINDNYITFGSSSSLIESPGNTVKGGIASCTKALNAPSSSNVIGVELTSSADLGSTVIIRGHTSQSGHGNNGILRYYDITPATNTGLNATLVFHYDESELNGLTESELVLFRSTDGGTLWETGSGSVDIANNTVTVNSLNAFSRWTLGSSSSSLHNIPPAAPQKLTITDSSSQTITFRWQKNTETDIQRYRIYRGTSSSPDVQVDSTTGSINDTARTHIGLTDGTRYYFRVSAVDNDGNESGYSNEVNAVPADRIPPAAPQNLTVTDSSSQTITFRWQKNTETDFQRYRIYRGTSSSPAAQVDSTAGGINDTTRTHIGLTDGTRYYFSVSAVDYAGNESIHSNEVNAVPADRIAPAAPQNLTVTDSSSQTITIKWNKNKAADFLQYRIYCSTSPNPTTMVGSTTGGINDTARTQTGLTNGTRYYFRVTTVDNAGNESGYSNEVNAAPGDRIAPAVPRNLTVIDSSSKTITIVWRKNVESDFQRYRIYCGTNPNPTAKVDSTTGGIADTTKTLTGLTNGTRYYCRITAVDNFGNESGFSNEVNSVPQTAITFVDGSWYKAPSVYSNTNNNPVGRFKLTADANGAALISVNITFSGSFAGVNKVKLWSSPDSVFSGDTKIDSVIYNDSLVTLNGNASEIDMDATYYFVTVDLGNSTGNITATIAVNADIVLEGGMLTGTILHAPLAGSSSVITHVNDEEQSASRVFALAQNYPNPFNPTTTITFTLAENSHVTLKVFDVLGREMVTLVNAQLRAGVVHHAILNASRFSSGLYFYRLETEKNVQVKKLMLLK